MLSASSLIKITYVIMFIFLIAEGVRRIKDQVFHFTRLAIAPIALLLLSIESLYHDLGLLIGHIALFTSGLVIITFFAFKNMHLSILIVSPSNKRIVLAGSFFPLFLYFVIFGIKYFSATLLLVFPPLSHNTVLFGILSLLYGSICGWFTGLFLLTGHQIYQAAAIPLRRSGQ